MTRRRTLVVAALVAGIAPGAVAATPASASPHKKFGERTLKKGVTGRDVRVLQDFLSRAGVDTHVDGRFGGGTRKKVRRWERLKRGAVNGAVSSDARASGVRVDGRLTRREATLLRQDVQAAEAGKAKAPASPPATAPGEKATLGPGGEAIAPASAPEVVKQIIAAGNEIHDLPYVYGGGHAPLPNKAKGYDCSGSMSYAFQKAGLLTDALTSGGFAAWGQPGPGQWVTTYGNGGHSFMVVAGLRFDTSGRSNAGSRWQTKLRPTSAYTVRHPEGL